MSERGWRQDAFSLSSEVIGSNFSAFSCHWSLVHPSGLVLDSSYIAGCMLIRKQKALGFTPSSLTDDVLCGLEHVSLPPRRS